MSDLPLRPRRRDRALRRSRNIMLVVTAVISLLLCYSLYLVSSAVYAGETAFNRNALGAAIVVSLLLLMVLAVLYERRMAKAISRHAAQQEKYLSSILQNSVDGIVMFDEQNRVVTWNRGAEMIFGYSEAEMRGRTFHRVIPEEVDADEELRHIEGEVFRQGYIRNYRALRLTRDGRRITIDLSRTLIRSLDGEPVGSVAIIRDVSEEMEMEQRMYNTEKLASIGTLAAGVAHEINNPLAVILGFTDLLKERFKPGSPEAEDLAIIEENAENAKRTVENLLGFARVDEGSHDRIDVVRSLQTVVNVVAGTLITDRIKLRTEIAETLPPIDGDGREFQQVVFNLINNAVAAMKETGGILSIDAWVEARRVCVRVTDTGPGIPDSLKPRIFDPFFTTKVVGEGTGLGLSICYGIVRKYGGSIDFFSHAAEDNPDDPTGSSFTVAIPWAGEESNEGDEV